jgi:hypothetical protein
MNFNLFAGAVEEAAAVAPVCDSVCLDVVHMVTHRRSRSTDRQHRHHDFGVMRHQ